MKGIFLFLFIFLANMFLTAQESGYANIDDAKIYYEQKGKGTPMIFLHGMYCDTRAWDYQFDEFAKNYHVIRFDLRGFGKSSVPDTTKPFQFVDDLVALMDYFNIEKAVIVGHSMGGIPSFKLAYNYPEKVLALVLSESGPYYKGIFANEDSKEFQAEFVKVREAAKKDGTEAAKKAFLNISILKPAMNNSFSKKTLVDMTMEYSGWNFENNNTWQPGPIRELSEYSQMNVPTLIFKGELSMPFYHRTMNEINEALPNSTLVEISNSGHMIQMENPKEFNKVLKQFLNKQGIK